MGNDLSEVADQAGAVVYLGIGVQDLLPDALPGQTDLVVWARLGGEVRDAGDHLTVTVVAQPREDVPAVIIGVDPGETRRVGVALPKGRVLLVDRVHVLDQPLYAAMAPLRALPPIDAATFGKLAPLAELGPHEQQLLARMRPHEGIEGAQRAKLPPLILRCPLEHRAFAVHHLVMTDRKDEVL